MNSRNDDRNALYASRIVFLLGSLEIGGAERQALHLAEYLKAEFGAVPVVCGFNSPGRMARLCEARGISWHLLPVSVSANPAFQLFALAKYARDLRAIRPDIILPYTFFPNVVAGLVWRFTGARLCVWNQRDEGIGYTSRPVQRLAARLTSLFIANSPGGAEFLERRLGAPHEAVHIVENGVVLDQPRMNRDEWRAALGVGEEAFLCCMLANLSHYKDHLTLLRAWQLVVPTLAAEGRAPLLLLAGILGDSYATVRDEAEALGVSGSVRFLGSVNDVSGLLAAVDLGVFSSRSEGCPNGVLESMAAGLPLVATDVPAIRSVMGAHNEANLVNMGDVQGFARRIAAFAADPALRATTGAENHARVRESFSPDRMCERMSGILARAIVGQPTQLDRVGT